MEEIKKFSMSAFMPKDEPKKEKSEVETLKKTEY